MYYKHVDILKRGTEKIDIDNLISTLQHMISYLYDVGYTSVGVEVSPVPFRTNLIGFFRSSKDIVDHLDSIIKFDSGYLRVEFYFGD